MLEHNTHQTTIDHLEEAVNRLHRGFTALSRNSIALSQAQSALNIKLDFILDHLYVLTLPPISPKSPPTDPPVPTPLPMPTSLPCLTPMQQSPTLMPTLLPIAAFYLPANSKPYTPFSDPHWAAIHQIRSESPAATSSPPTFASPFA